MKTIEIIGWAVGLPLTVLGIMGGLLGLPAKIRDFRQSLRAHGDKGTGWILLGRDDDDTETQVRFLVFDDLVHALDRGVYQLFCNFELAGPTV